MTPAERKQMMRRGGITRAAKLAGVSKVYASWVMNDEVNPKTKKGLRTLVRTQKWLARQLGLADATMVFGTPTLEIAHHPLHNVSQ